MATEKRPLTPEEAQFIRDMHLAVTDGTLYDVLGVHGETSPGEVEAAYHEMARKWHPDRFYARDTGELAAVIDENFATATRAYRTLRDPIKKSAYDRELSEAGRAPPPPPDDWRWDDPGAPLTPGERVPSRPSVSAPSGPGLRAPSSPGFRAPSSPGFRAPSGPGERPAPAPAEPPRKVPSHETKFRPASAPEIPKPKPKAPPAVAKHLAAMLAQKRKAEEHYENGKKEFEARQYGKAESALYLAMAIDPKNATYKELYEKARERAREGRAKSLVQQADTAAKFGKPKEAIQLLRQAVECDPPEGEAYFKLATLLRTQEDDARGALQNLRKAAQKEPKNVAFRVALAEMYASIELKANALREIQAVLEMDPKHEAAKTLLKKLK